MESKHIRSAFATRLREVVHQSASGCCGNFLQRPAAVHLRSNSYRPTSYSCAHSHDFPKTPMLRSYPLSWTAVKCTGAGAANFGERYALSAGGSFTPHVIIVGTGEDVAARIMSFSQNGPRSVCILSANGTISNVTLRQPDTSGSTFTYEGRFEILQLMGSFTMAEEGRRRTGGLSVSLAGPDGRVVGGVVAGMLRAASPIQVIVGSFLPNSLKQHQRRMSLQQQASAIPALPAPPVPPPVLTAATPISQASPGNGFHAPPPSAAMPPQPHASTEEHGAMNLNATGFTMVGWPASSQPAARRASPDINVSLTPQE
ncbi:AT-hook motif nuclear-localized protein 7-like isoform X2 [Panicum virgatum]|uniref:AT-hook motif nuclear-localized protein 7-like isoform X2 n=1 Tax=Panicum virgatum TaxID=38727 RepID=UPI0019D61E30|nr:AT-hook motif nuclear-localized protein 7-like isoform X2 [Panicum virgatum]XP_039775888.1 AT-hook motif nuclear-localized protein 7-like isoform X2 [Panicum virgatum]XP_039775889.1 AT-hook motif nuclear-localized protein 7-like isoform X2 [Panicum virgatum]